MFFENGLLMLSFALCLMAAGGILSLIARVQGLLAVLLGVALACCAVILVRWFDDMPAVSLGVTLIVAIGALQIGYGIGVVARAAFELRSRRSQHMSTATLEPQHDSASKSENALGENS
jgi:hypothetical protein